MAWNLVLAMLLVVAGCAPESPSAESVMVWSKQGPGSGDLYKPRGIVRGHDNLLYIVDMTGRIQVFDEEGKFVRYWKTPTIVQGKPCGLGWTNDGLLMVADTHYYRVLFYHPDGTPVPERTIGGVNGRGPGEFGFVTDAAQDAAGNYYVSDYGDYDRIQKFDAAGNFLMEWGGHGDGPGEFNRPQSLAVDEQGMLWVSDACNHRIQVFDTGDGTPRLIHCWGKYGEGPDQMRYPYGLVLGDDNSVYVTEFGNHRIQKFTRDGKSLGIAGGPGRLPGQFQQPWALCLDSQNRLVVLDTYHHQVQSFFWPNTPQPPQNH